MENKTAVEWIEDELSKLNSAVIYAEITQEEYHKQRVGLWEKAKQIEKEQIIKANDDGALMAYALPFNAPFKKGEEYYNETYGSQAPQRLKEANEE
jgi:hypothetical protein